MREWMPPTSPRRSARVPPAVRPPAWAAGVLSLQRKAGNAATQRLLARQKADPAPVFRLLLVDDGDTGLNDEILKVAVENVRKEILRITKTSTNDAVKGGFEVQHRTAKPEAKEVRDLGQRTWLIFLTRGSNAKHAVDLAHEYVPLYEDERQAQEARFKKRVAAEGGVDIQRAHPRRRTSESVGFVGTGRALKELEKHNGGTASAGALVADVVLHELGHALGHNDVLSDIDHDDSGIMTASLVIDSGQYRTRQFSSKSAKIIRDRLEELANKPARKRE